VATPEAVPAAAPTAKPAVPLFQHLAAAKRAAPKALAGPAPASAVASDYFVVPSVGNKLPPCTLPVWCVIPNPDDIEQCVEILRVTVGNKVPTKRLLFGKRAWILLGRRIQEVSEGPQPDIGLATPRASRSHALLLRNWLGQVFLMDLGSGNGTIVDGKKLRPKDVVRWKIGAKACFADDQTETFELCHAG